MCRFEISVLQICYNTCYCVSKNCIKYVKVKVRKGKLIVLNC